MKAFRTVSLPPVVRHGLLALAVFSVMGAGGAVPSVPTNVDNASKGSATRVALKGVPYVPQMPNYCGPAALSSIFSFWGKSVPQSAIGREVFDRRQNATNGADLLMYAREEGFAAYTYLSSPRELKAQLRDGFPVLILQEMSLRDTRGHFRIVIGFNDRTETFLVRDSNYEEDRSIPYEEFEATWSAFGRWSLIICPREKEAKLSAKLKDNPVLHLDLGLAYLRRRQDRLARRHFEETLRLEPRNEEALGQLASLDEDLD